MDGHGAVSASRTRDNCARFVRHGSFHSPFLSMLSRGDLGSRLPRSRSTPACGVTPGSRTRFIPKSVNSLEPAQLVRYLGRKFTNCVPVVWSINFNCNLYLLVSFHTSASSLSLPSTQPRTGDSDMVYLPWECSWLECEPLAPEAQPPLRTLLRSLRLIYMRSARAVGDDFGKL